MSPIVRRHVLSVGVALVAATLGTILFASVSASQEKDDAAADLLNQINKHYEKAEYEDVLRLGQKIAEIDKYGDKYQGTASVYATMATCAMLLGQKADKDGDPTAAVAYFKRAAWYNRAFGSALMLHHKMPGVTKQAVDDQQTLYK